MRTSTTVARRALDVAGVCMFVVACPLPQAHAAVVSGPGHDTCVSGPEGAGPGAWVTASASPASGTGAGTGGASASPSPWPSHSAAPKPSPSAAGRGGDAGGGGWTGISAAQTSAADSGDGATPRVRSGRYPPARWGTQGSATALGLVAPAGAAVPIQIGPPSPGAPAQVSSPRTSSRDSAGPVVSRADRQRDAALARDHRQALALLTTLLVIALVPVVVHLALRRRGRR